MSNVVVNYHESITTPPKQLVYPQTAEQIQAVGRDTTS